MVRQRIIAVVASSVVGLLVGWGLWSAFTDPNSPEHLRPRSDLESVPTVPRIDLARLAGEPAPRTRGERDLFDFGKEAATPAPEPSATPSDDASPRPTPRPPRAVSKPTPATLEVRYVGSVERPDGLKIAVLISMDDVVLTGRKGELIANRLKVVKIGLESVDVQDLGSERVRRIPLKAR